MNRTNMTTAETNDKDAAVAQRGAPVGPLKASPKKGASRKHGSPKRQTTAKGSKTGTARPAKEAKTRKKAVNERSAKATTPRTGTKTAKILEMIGRAKGATLAEIMKATDWQAHSVRGFLSIAAKKLCIKIESARNEADDRVYRIVK